MKKSFKKSILFMWLALLGFIMPMQVMADDYYLIGTFTNNWDLNSAIKLTPNGNQYEIKQSFNEKDEFKIVKNKDWNQGSWGYSNVNDKSLVEKIGDNNAKILKTGCYGLYFKPSDNTIYIAESSDCPQPYSLWGFDFRYQEGGSGGTKKWASTKGSAAAWDGNFIATSADGETFDLGVIKRKSRFIGFRFYTNSNGAEVNGANVIWRNTDNNVKAIEGSDYGKWSNDGTKASTVAGTDAVWHQTDRNNALLGYENGTYSFDLVFELKVNNQEKKEVRTIHITYTINEFELTTNLSGPCHVGDLVQLNISGGTAPYTWQSSNDGISWSTLSGASGTAYTHKVADKTFIRAKDSNGNITNVVELTPSIRCDKDHTITIFKETFGTLSGVDARASYSKKNVAVEGTNITYTASVPYTASTVSCGAMTDGGYYAVLANPRNAGCGTNIAQGTQNCNCVDEVDKVNTRWYRNTTDHTGDTNGGMLMYNCKDGTSTTDVLYECIINGLCDSTYINFSAFVTCANRGLHGNIPIEAEFKLFNAANNVEIDTYEVKNIGLSEEWKEISAMFNSGAATSVKIQLINKAGDGQGNDLLFDDMTLSICTPEANLVCSDGVSTESVIVAGGSETLTASVLSGVMNKPYYLWQYQVGRANWVSMGEPQRDHATITVTPESSPTKYRVILANSIHEAEAVADGSTGKACGVHAITNEVTVYAAFVTLSAATSVGNICLDGEDPSQLTLTITNPSGIEINNLKVNAGIPTNYINKVTVASGTGYSNNVWNVGTLANGASKTLKLNLKSDAATDEAVKEVDIKPYVSQLNNQTWANYDDSPTKSSAKLALNQVTKTPTAVTDYFECAKTGTLTLASLVTVENPANLVFYDGETSLTTVTSVNKSDTSIDKYYYFTYQEGTKCVSKRGKVHVKIIPVPTASITSVASQTKCAAENYTFSISAEAKNGTGIWSVTSGAASIDNVNSASTTAKVEAGKTATLTWTVSNEKCDATAFTTLSVDKQPKVTLLDGKGSASICGKSEFTVAVEEFTGSGIWEILSETSSKTEAFIGKPNEKETPVTGIESGEKVELQYTANNGECKSIKSEVVTLKNLVCNNFSLTNTFNDDDKEICLNSPTSLTISITNNSQATSTNIKTSIVLPEGLTYVSHSSGANYDNTTGLWTIASLGIEDENKTAELTINVIGSSEGSHTVNAIIKEATKTEVEGMEIRSTIKVNALPTAKFKESTSEVCIKETNPEETNPKGTTQVEVEFTGAPDYTLKYKLGDSEYTTEPAVSSPHIIQKEISADATITLISVKDKNGCENTIADQSHEVKAIFPAVITILVPDKICADDSLTLSAPTITGNGSNVTDGKWYLGGEVYIRKSPVGYDKDGAILQYIANSSCGGEVRSNEVNITVNSAPSITINADGNLPADICAGKEYILPTVNVDNNGEALVEETEGWYLGATKIYLGEGKYSYSGGTKITLDQGEYTFSINDNEKSLVYKAENSCGETFKEFRPKLDVNDCSNFIFEYFSDTTVCKDAEVVLTAKITNNSNYDLSNVILAQSWSGEQIASKDANNNVKEIFVTSGDVRSAYDKDNHLWKIETFTAHKSATLTITFSAQKSEYFSMYMTESNGVEYNNTNTDNSDDSPVIIDGEDKVELKVLEISGPVTLKPGKNYNGVCPTDEKVSLSSLVEYNATDILYFYDKYKNKLTEEPSFDTSKELSATYYIKREEKDKCISDQFTDVNLKIFKPVGASISATKTTICSGTKSDVKITVDSGTPDFTIVYNNGVKDTTETISGTTLNIADELLSTTTYKLISVTDAHKCEAKLDDIEPVTIKVNPRPELASFEIEDTDDIICEGTSTNLKANFKGTPDFKFTLQTTKAVDGVTKTETTDYTINDSEWSMEISEAGQYKITKLLDKYCESATLTDAELTLTVEGLPELTLSATDVTLNCTTPTATITASGASTYEWSYLDQTGATQTKSGATLALQQTDPDVSSLVTEYTVYGYSKNASCKSEEAKTVKVTEDFVKPVVDIKISETADGTIPERLDCYQQNIKLEADLTNNKETIVEYIWSSGSDNNTTLINNPGTYTLQVKGENGCISDVATETIEQNIVKPEVSIESYITDPVTGNIIPTVELTCANNEITLEGTITNADQYAEDYPNGEFTYLWSDGSTTSSTVAKTPLATSPMEYTLIVTSPNGCLNEVDKAKVTVTENVSAPVLNIESVYKLCPSDTLSVKALSSLLPKTAGVTYKFYDEAGVEIDDFYGASSENPVSTYYVVGTSENGCSSEKVAFDVDFAKNVDFTLTTSQTSMLVGGNETLVTIVPNEDSEVADTYTWLSNGKDILVEGLEYSANLYLDTKFEVTATNRCDTDTQEASVEVLWPTAFTPHNANGKNDDFAKGMHIIVFNRFYTKIFEGPDGWDGTINGAMNESESIAVPGVYYYSVQLPNGEVKKGTIEIVR